MPAFDWDAELTDEARDALIEKIARRVLRHHLATPAILILEMHKPLGFLAGQSLLLGSGFLAPLVGPENLQQFSKLLQSRESLELLIRRIEDLQKSEESGAGTPDPAAERG